MIRKTNISMLVGFFVILSAGIWHTHLVNKTTPNNHMDEKTTSDKNSSLLLAGGCFWCVEADLEKLPGVIEVTSGYAGGHSTNPTYETYKAGVHREVVEVIYDATKVSFREVVIYALKHMDPTDGEGSFYDRGFGYSPALYFQNNEEKLMIEEVIEQLNSLGIYATQLQVAVEARPVFYRAEEYHQDYYKGTLSGLRYQYYRSASGRDAFIEKHWGNNTGPALPQDSVSVVIQSTAQDSLQYSWSSYKKPGRKQLQKDLDSLAYTVTQEDATERAFSSPLDKNYERGIYVDILSGEPLFSSRDKFDSGTGWPSFTKSITESAVTKHIDRKLWMTRTEVRSAIADNHLGHVFTDGPVEHGGLRYCMNGVALHFIPLADMVDSGYGNFVVMVE